MAKRSKEDSNVLVAIDKDKGSQYALKWAVDHLLSRNQTVTLLHVREMPSIGAAPATGTAAEEESNRSGIKPLDNGKELFLPFRCFCTRKEIHCNEVLTEDSDITRAILNYVSENAVDILVLGAPSRGGIVRRFRMTDKPTNIQKAAPDFCTVYIISKGKVSSVRAASGPTPAARPAIQNQQKSKPTMYEISEMQKRNLSNAPRERQMFAPPSPGMSDDMEIKSPFTRPRGPNSKPYEPAILDDISFVSSGRPSTERAFPSFSDNIDIGMSPRFSNVELDFKSFGSSYSGNRSGDNGSYSSSSQDNARMSYSSQNMDDMEAEMRRLRLELKQTMDMYSSACKEALVAKQKATELHRWKLEEQQRLEEARMAEEAALALVQKEKAKSKAAIEAAEVAQRLAQLEAQKRMTIEKKALRDAEERKKTVEPLGQGELRYRRYTIEEIEAATDNFIDSLKVGEGGYGPVYKCYLDHTPVAVKVLRPDAAQGRAQFQQEVEVLSCIRHPNMVLLLGACPEYGCLVYEYMANGSLDDRLFRRGNTPVLSWQMRFRIAAEIATGLLFLHQTKPEPLVHRDLKPGNILLDRNFVSKISDVGLARLVPPSVANSVTQYRMTSTAGTFCYIDPEYQQTGMLGIKSDIYSLGIMLLQIITAKPPMGLTHHVERALERGTLADILDPAVSDWPMEEAAIFAQLALQCAELRRKDRPDLGKVVLPELNKLRALAEDNMPNFMFGASASSYSQASTVQDVMSDQQSGYESSRSRSSTASYTGKRL